MTGREMFERVAEDSGLSKKIVAQVLNTFFADVIDELSDGGEVAIKGFGKFQVVESAPRLGRNPKTGDTVQIPAKKTVRFYAGDNLKVSVNNK